MQQKSGIGGGREKELGMKGQSGGVMEERGMSTAHHHAHKLCDAEGQREAEEGKKKGTGE